MNFTQTIFIKKCPTVDAYLKCNKSIGGNNGPKDNYSNQN